MLDLGLLAPQFRRMTLATRARLAWIPLLLWLAFCFWHFTDRLPVLVTKDVFALSLEFLFKGGVFAAGCAYATRYALDWKQRARTEGPDVVLPMTWHKRSGSWAVIAIFGGMLAMFGGFALIAALGG